MLTFDELTARDLYNIIYVAECDGGGSEPARVRDIDPDQLKRLADFIEVTTPGLGDRSPLALTLDGCDIVEECRRRAA